MPWIVKPCEHCNVDFRSDTWVGHEARFCSCSCRQKFNLKHKPECFPCIKQEKRIAQCRECGKDYWQRHLDKYFCNTECYLIWKRKQTPRLTCCICNKQYVKTRNIKQTKILTCSKECNEKYFYNIKKQYCTPRFQKSESAKIHGIACEKCLSLKHVHCHHLDCDRENNPLDGSNWMRLCSKCHKRTHVAIKKKKRALNRVEILKLHHIPVVSKIYKKT